jgi:N-acetylmuramoyl-L-alanine amidase
MKIYIDAGHNYDKWNTGATGNGLREQDVTFYIADDLRDILIRAGLEVKMSREKLTDILGTDNASSLSSRYNGANVWRADYFISIHTNSGGGSGTETLVYSAGGEAERLAREVQREIVRRLDMKDRGVKYRSGLAVLKHTKMPAILVETGFIDNWEDAQKLKDRQYDFAQAISEGLFDYLGISPHWGQEFLQKLMDAGIISNPEVWENYDEPVAKVNAAALVDKATGHSKKNHIESLYQKGFITDVSQWTDGGDTTKGLFLALVDKATGGMDEKYVGRDTDHWARNHLDSLADKGFITTVQAWTNFDAWVNSAQAMALVAKAFL